MPSQRGQRHNGNVPHLSICPMRSWSMPSQCPMSTHRALVAEMFSQGIRVAIVRTSGTVAQNSIHPRLEMMPTNWLSNTKTLKQTKKHRHTVASGMVFWLIVCEEMSARDSVEASSDFAAKFASYAQIVNIQPFQFGCRFCQNNGESPDVCSSHVTKTKN